MRPAGAGVHLAEELRGERLELRGVGADRIEQVGEAGGGQEADVLGEHAEEAAAEEIGHQARGVPGLFEGLGELGQQIGDVAGDVGGVARGIEGERVGPDQAEALADFRPAQVLQPDAEGLRMGEGEVVAARLGEVGEDLDAVAHVHDEQERGIGVAGGQRADVALGLAAGFEHGVVPRARAANRGGLALPGDRAGGFERKLEVGGCGGLILELLGFEEEGARACRGQCVPRWLSRRGDARLRETRRRSRSPAWGRGAARRAGRKAQRGRAARWRARTGSRRTSAQMKSSISRLGMRGYYTKQRGGGNAEFETGAMMSTFCRLTTRQSRRETQPFLSC